MKLLQLCNKVPYPEKDGGAIGISTFSKGLLASGQQVKMLAMNTSRHFVETDSIAPEFRDALSLETVYVDTSIKPFKAFLTLLSGESYNISRFCSNEFNTRLTDILKREPFDVIQLEGLYLTPYIKTIRALSKAPVILREHNVEWLIWQRLAEEEKNPFKAIYLRVLTHQLKQYEVSAINVCNGITTTTINDMDRLKQMGCKVPVAHIPFGIDTAKYQPGTPRQSHTLFYIGALDWLPNIQALDWFLQEVWPKVHTAYPNIEFHVAGRNMPDKYKTASFPGAVFHGEVENAHDFMNTYSIMVVPLLAGSGVRVKIIEGMAMRKPIITTTVGIEGIECKYGNDVLVADNAEDFYAAIKKCIDNPSATTALAANGYAYAMANHNISQITNNLLSFYKECIGKAK